MHLKCVKCGELIRTKQQKLICHACEVVCHRTCTGLTQDEYRSMNREKVLESWLCDDCDGSNSPVISSGRVRKEVAMSVSDVDDVLDQLQGPVHNETVLQNASISPGNVENTGKATEVHGITAQNTEALSTVPASEVQTTLTESDGTPNGVSTLPGEQRILSTFGSAQNVVLTTSLQNVMSLSTVQSAVAISSAQDSVSISGVQSAMSKSGVPSSLSTSVGVQSTVSASGVQSSLLSTGGVQSAVSASDVQSSCESLREEDAFTSAVHSVINRIRNVLSKTQSVRPNTTQCQTQREGIGEDTSQKQPGPNEQQNIVQKSCNKQVGTEKGVSEIQYSCCDVHGKVKPKTQESIKQELLPFEEKIGDMLERPHILYHSLRPVTDSFKFRLKEDQLEMVMRSINSRKNNVQVKLRFSTFSRDTQIKRREIKVNHRKVKSNNCNKVDLIKANKEQQVEIVDITDEIRKDLSANVVDIEYVSMKICMLNCELVKKNSVADLLELMVVNHPEHTEELIKQKFKGDDDIEISTTNLKASLICPIGKMRLLKPCRSKHCTHIQCIDASTVLGLNQTNPKWKCQLCQEPAKFDDLYIDGLFLKILASVPWDVVEVEFQKDGSWTHKKSSSQTSEKNEVDKENFCNLLDETTEKLDVIDLTETDDECTPVKRAPLKTNTALVNHIAKRLGSGGSTCSESSSRIVSSSSTSSVSSSNSTSDYSSLSSCNYRSTAISSTYNNDHSSYGCHKKSRHAYRPKGPYQVSRNYGRNHSGYHNTYTSGPLIQTTIDHYSNSWSNVHSNVSIYTGSSRSNYYNSFW